MFKFDKVFIFLFCIRFLFTCIWTLLFILLTRMLSRTKVLHNEPSVALYHFDNVPKHSTPNFVLSATSMGTAWYLLMGNCHVFLHHTFTFIKKFFTSICWFITRKIKCVRIFFFLCLPICFLCSRGISVYSPTVLAAGMQLRWSKDYRDQTVL